MAVELAAAAILAAEFDNADDGSVDNSLAFELDIDPYSDEYDDAWSSIPFDHQAESLHSSSCLLSGGQS